MQPTMHFCKLLLSLIISLLPFLVTSQDDQNKVLCYYPDGSEAPAQIPCRPNSEHSHCCSDGNVCLSNGLCLSPGLNAVVRRGCTDKTWQSDACPDTCNIEEFSTGDAPLTFCGNYNKLCCGDDKAARDCCEDHNGTLAVDVPSAVVLWPASITCTSGPPIETSMSMSTCAPASCPTDPSAAPSNTSSALPTCTSTDVETARNALAGVTAFLGIAAIAAAIYGVRERRKVGREKAENRKLGREKEKLERELEKVRLPGPWRNQSRDISGEVSSSGGASS